MISIDQIKKNDELLGFHPLWRSAFRACFLFSCAFAVVSVLLWFGVLRGKIGLAEGVMPFWWHAHEMLFGFGILVQAGFLLTAVQNWTGRTSLTGCSLQCLLGSWLLARVFLLFGEFFWLSLVFQAFFYALLLWGVAAPVWLSRNYRNVKLVVMLSGFACLDLTMYLSLFEANWTLSSRVAEAVLWLYAVLMSVMGGRVIPFFSERKLNIDAHTRWLWLEGLAIFSLIGMVATTLAELDVAKPYLLWLAFFSNLIRWLRWQHIGIYKEALLWSLHLSYLAIPVTALLAWLTLESANYKSALHLLAIGAMGLMMFSMIARVSLGHSGRPLIPSPWAAWGLAGVIFAALARVLGPLADVSYFVWLLVSVLFWVSGVTLIFLLYWRVWLSPRADGRPG